MEIVAIVVNVHCPPPVRAAPGCQCLMVSERKGGTLPPGCTMTAPRIGNRPPPWGGAVWGTLASHVRHAGGVRVELRVPVEQHHLCCHAQR